MTDKSELQIAKEREAVDAMRNAKANMGAVLDRVGTLELALKAALDGLKRAKAYIAPTVYAYPVAGKVETVHTEIERCINAAQAKLDS